MNEHQMTRTQSSGRTFLRLLSYVKPHATSLVLGFLVLFLATGGNVIGPILTKTFIDTYLTPKHFPLGPLLWLGGGYLALHFLSVGLTYVQLLTFQRIALRVIQQIRLDVFGKVQQLGLAFFDKTPAGALVSRITNDTEAIKDLYVSVLSSFVQNIVLITGVFVSMFYLNARLASICLLLVPIVYFMMRTYRRLSSSVFHLSRQKLALLNAKLNESLQGMYLVQAMRQERRLRSEFNQINDEYTIARLKAIKLNGLMLRPLVDIISLSTLALVLGFFGVRSSTATIDIGVLYAFVNYLDRMFEPVNDMMERLNLFQQSMVAAERVFELLDEKTYAPGKVVGDEGSYSPTVRHGEIQFEHVSFSYDGNTEVLKDITFSAKPGQTVALVGHTGSGKSTITNLLLRFYNVTGGQITIDGHPLSVFDNEELRAKIGLVLQDPFLFVGDIRQNIRLGNEHISDEQVRAAAAFVQADEFIRCLPHQYDEPIGERGATLSAGQRQLLSFARTMAIEPKILVLDEATASIDTETEEAIQEALERMRKGRTTIAIAHRLSTIQDADLILVLHHGQIVERGTHQELLAQEGLYHKMYLMQQGAVAPGESAV